MPACERNSFRGRRKGRKTGPAAYARSVGEPLRTLETPDGRTLAYAVWGDADGFPILSLHGTPGCRLGRWPHEEVYAELGVCVVTHDRAGYGRSDRRRGRRVADEADDVRAIADELGFDRFGVTGASGGGPHSLACAALLPDRVVRATCVVGVAPLGTPGLEQEAWLAGQDPENVKEFDWAMAGEDVLTRELQAEQQRMEERVAADPSTLLQRLRSERVRPRRAGAARGDADHERVDAGAGGQRRRRVGRRRPRVHAAVGVRPRLHLGSRAGPLRADGRARSAGAR